MIVTQTEVPPTLGRLTHALWALGIAILAVGIAAALQSIESLRRVGPIPQYVGWTGVLLGTLTFGLWTVALVFAFGGGGDGHVLFDIATLLLPALSLWAMVLGVGLRRANSRLPTSDR